MGRAPGADDDPLTLAIAPPTDETPEMRTHRLQDEQRAKEISDEIDNQLSLERNALKKRQKMVKVLLLGQSESGECCFIEEPCARRFLGQHAGVHQGRRPCQCEC